MQSLIHLSHSKSFRVEPGRGLGPMGQVGFAQVRKVGGLPREAQYT